MLRVLPLLTFIAGALALPAAIHAQAATGAGAAAYRVQDFVGIHHLSDGKTSMVRSGASAPAFHVSTDRAFASAPPGDGLGRTALDHRFAPDGAVGSLGFVCVNDGQPLAVHDMAVAADSNDGRLVGATLSLPFR